MRVRGTDGALEPSGYQPPAARKDAAMAATPEDNRRTTDPESTPHRRAEDRESGTPVTESGKLTAREIFQKMRRPMIGLGMIGAAVPMVNATNAADQSKSDASTPALQSAGLAPTTGAGADTEEKIAAQIATTREDQEREEHITTAME